MRRFYGVKRGRCSAGSGSGSSPGSSSGTWNDEVTRPGYGGELARRREANEKEVKRREEDNPGDVREKMKKEKSKDESWGSNFCPAEFHPKTSVGDRVAENLKAFRARTGETLGGHGGPDDPLDTDGLFRDLRHDSTRDYALQLYEDRLAYPR